MKELLEQAEALSGELVRWRRHIHENPEVGADLPDTCAYVTEELKKIESLELVINQAYRAKVDALRTKAGLLTHDARNPVFRLLQIIEHLKN